METGPNETEDAFLIVEDDAALAKAFAVAMRRYAPTVVTRTIREAEIELPKRRWTGVLIDVGLPDGNGLELLARVRKNDRRVSILIVTGWIDPSIANRAHLHHAACVYKPDIVDNLEAFIRRAIANRAESHARTAAAVQALQEHADLSPREAHVARLVSLGMPRESLAEKLGVSENTIKTIVRRLLTKSSESSVEGIARSVLEEVVRLSPDLLEET